MSESKAVVEGQLGASMAPNAGMLSTITDTSLTQQGGYAPPAYGGPVGDPMAGGVDFMRVWHAVRRRWMIATTVGLALAMMAAPLAWFLLPRGYEAVAWLRVRSNPGTFTGGGGGSDYEQYRKTQLQLIKSPFVLNSALRRPGIAGLVLIKEEKDPVDWLTRYLQVSAPSESEVVQVRLRGSNAREVTQVVNAVTQAYLTDVVNKEKTERLARRDMLERKYKENMAEVRNRMETFNNLARSLGTRDSSEVGTQRSLLLDHLGTLRAQLTQLQRDLVQIDTELAILEATPKVDGDGAAGGDDEVDSMLMRHPQLAELSGRLSELEETIAFQAGRSARGANDPAVRRLTAQRADLLRRIEDRAAELRPQVAQQLAAEWAGRRGGGAADANPAMLRMRREMLATQLEGVSKEFDQVAKEVTVLGNANADLEARKNEIAQLQAVTNQMGIQLNASEVDIAMPNRVELIEEASVPGEGEELFRAMLSGLAAVVGLGLGFGGVVLLEYQRDRLDTAEEISQRIGIRVIGTVPAISRSGKSPNHAHVAECVDGVRAVISQTGREAPKVIIVTSAVEHEGKTTFAAQLAASLARAGNRTLIVDGDLRHPNTHLALELDLRVGLPELLRGEIGADEAVQPTSVDGLFAVTGGSCDYAAITALSRSETSKVIKAFRGSFDTVVIDAGPVLAFADVLLLGQLSDAAIVVTMRDVSRVPLVGKAVDRLRSVGIRVLGTVVNGVSETTPHRQYASPLPA
jgi:capsular exopolysaccharide synthesis family protein